MRGFRLVNKKISEVNNVFITNDSDKKSKAMLEEQLTTNGVENGTI